MTLPEDIAETASPRQTSPPGSSAGSLAAVFAVAGFYLVAAPQPESEPRLGATRPTAVAPGTAAVSDPTHLAEVKIVGAAADGSKPCHEQTWPYIEQRCLTPAAKDAPRDSGTVAQPLGLRALLLLGVRAQAAASGAPQVMATETQVPTITPSQDTAAADGTAAIHDPDIPLPQPRPNGSVADLSMGEDDEEAEFYMPPMMPLSRAEHRRMEREWRRMERAERHALEYSNRMLRRDYREAYRGRNMRNALDRFIRNFR
jgi:hypothetical protein